MLFVMKMPDGYYWDYPGFPSLTVAYGNTNDFYFSGHVGGSVICACEFFRQKSCYGKFMTVFAIITAFM